MAAAKAGKLNVLALILGIAIFLGVLLPNGRITGNTIWNPELEQIEIQGKTVFNLSEHVNGSCEFLLPPNDKIPISLNGSLLTITPNHPGTYKIEIIANNENQVETLELKVKIKNTPKKTPKFIQEVETAGFEARFWNYTLRDVMEVEFSHTSDEAQSIWAENATVSKAIAHKDEKVKLTLAPNTTAALYIGLEGPVYIVRSQNLESPQPVQNHTTETEEREEKPEVVQRPAQSQLVKTETDEPVAKKLEEDPHFDTHFITVQKNNQTLKVQFYHDSILSQPVWIEGEVAYNLSTETAQPHENVTLTVPLVKGKVPKFKLHVGAESEVFEFGITVLNVYSHPTVGGEWKIDFTTEGVANLTITGTHDISYTNSTTYWTDYSDNASLYDLKLLEITCNGTPLTHTWQGTGCSENECSAIVQDYECEANGSVRSKVLTSGKHVLRFEFGDENQTATDYAYNDAATIQTILLKTTDSPHNTVAADLFLELNITDADNDSTKNITVWYVNSQPIQTLNMPFEAGSPTKDYAAGNTGSTTGATFNNTAGHDSFGAYKFDGDNDYIDLGSTQYLHSDQPFTLTLWARLEDFTNGNPGIATLKTGQQWNWLLGFSNRDGFKDIFMGSYSGFSILQTGDIGITTGNWYHLAILYHGGGYTNDSSYELYLNGQEKTLSSAPGLMFNDQGNSKIGIQGDYSWNGTLDDVTIWNRTLSLEQIQALYDKKTGFIADDETQVGENWTANVTPNDRTSDGQTEQSNTIEIQAANTYTITECGHLNYPGTYVLQNDLNQKNWSCLVINASQVTLDCDGHTIYGNQTQTAKDPYTGNPYSGHRNSISTYWHYSENPSLESIAIHDCTLKALQYVDNQIDLKGTTGMVIYDNNFISNNTGAGISAAGENLQAYNNFFNFTPDWNGAMYTDGVKSSAYGTINLTNNTFLGSYGYNHVSSVGAVFSSAFNGERLFFQRNNLQLEPGSLPMDSYIPNAVISHNVINTGGMSSQGENASIYKNNLSGGGISCGDNCTITDNQLAGRAACRNEGLIANNTMTITGTHNECLTARNNSIITDNKCYLYEGGCSGGCPTTGRRAYLGHNTTMRNTLASITLDFQIDADSVIPAHIYNLTIVSRNHSLQRNMTIDATLKYSEHDTWYLTLKPLSRQRIGSKPPEESLERFFDISAANDSWIYLNVTYPESESSQVNESTLSFWKLEPLKVSRGFYQIKGRNPAPNIVYANLTNLTRTGEYTIGIFEETTPVLTYINANATDHPINATTANLTVHTKGYHPFNYSYKNITVWHVRDKSYEDGVPIQLRNMPFEGISNSTTTKEYVQGMNGTVHGATHNITGGHDGFGAYGFDGSSSYIDIGQITFPEDFTYSIWFKTPNTNSVQLIASNSDGTYNRPLYTYTSTNNQGVNAIVSTTESSSEFIYSSQQLQNNQWYHLAIVFKSGEYGKAYLNGELKYTDDEIVGTRTNSDADAYIGRSPHTASYVFEGMIDDFIIWNRTLSEDQIKAIYNSRTDIVADETHGLELWYAKVTPTDARKYGSTLQSNDIVVNTEWPDCPNTDTGNWHLFSSYSTNESIVCGNITISGTLTIRNDLGGYQPISLTAQNFRLTNSGKVLSNGRGYPQRTGPGRGNNTSSSAGTGAGHGGRGGKGYLEGGDAYGNLTHPETAGSGGGTGRESRDGGSGGGAIVLNATNARIDGNVKADGTDGEDGGDNNGWALHFPAGGGGGSGGTILVLTKNFTGTGNLTAKGGKGGDDPDNNGQGTGGGGGRIAIHAAKYSFNGLYELQGGAYGTGPSSDPNRPGSGGAGTLYINVSTQQNLTISNSNNARAANTPLTGQRTNYTYIEVLHGSNVSSTSEVTSREIFIDGSAAFLRGCSGTFVTLNNTYGSITNVTANRMSVNQSNIAFGLVNVPNVTIGSSTISHLPNNAPSHNNTLQFNTYNLTLDAESQIDVTGKGYTQEQGPGAGYGTGTSIATGAGHGGLGGKYTTSSAPAGTEYGNITRPTAPGSGGGEGDGRMDGGNGGGAVFLNITYLELAGNILAHGSAGESTTSSSNDYEAGGGGSGGSILIIANSISGDGNISADGGAGGDDLSTATGSGGAGGRIAIHAQQYSLTGTLSATGGSYGGGTGSIPESGGAGTIFKKIGDYEELTIHNHGQTRGAYTPVTEFSSTDVLKIINEGRANITQHFYSKNITVSSTRAQLDNITGEVVLINDSTVTLLHVRAQEITIQESSTITHLSRPSHPLRIFADNFTIAQASKIDVTGKGYSQRSGPGAGQGASTFIATGAGHGGEGGYYMSSYPTEGGPAYGNLTHPTTLGSGGGEGDGGYEGGSGGGAIHINATKVTLNGTLITDGAPGESAESSSTSYEGGGGGSGGSILITATTVLGTGNLSAKGGKGGDDPNNNGQGSGGAGGRIAIHSEEYMFTGAIEAQGGAYGTGPGSYPQSGGAGTIYKEIGQYTSLRVDGKGSARTAYTPITDISSTTVLDILDGSKGNITQHYTSENITISTATAQLDNITFENLRVNNSQATLQTVRGQNITIKQSSVTHRTLKEIDIIANHLTADSATYINVTGKGYPQRSGPGAGQGASTSIATGAGHGGTGGAYLSTYPTYGGNRYGNITHPTTLGSGGGEGDGGYEGGSGGGRVKINVTALYYNGTITADGAPGESAESSSTSYEGGGGGSGGSILITATTVLGTGNLSAKGGTGGDDPNNNGQGSGGGGGRIAIHSEEYMFTGTIEAQGGAYGTGPGSYPQSGGAGTIYRKTGSTDWLDIDNNNRLRAANTTLDIQSVTAINILSRADTRIHNPFTTENITISNANANLENITAETFTVNASQATLLTVHADIMTVQKSTLTHQTNPPKILEIFATNFTLGSTSKITLDGKGYPGGQGGGYDGTGPGRGEGYDNSGGGGAGYGGTGGAGKYGSYGGAGGTTYGSMIYPSWLGSGGGGGDAGEGSGGSGGGGVLINASLLNISGNISAKGEDGQDDTYGAGGAGSGGSILLQAAHLTGTGFLSAIGGDGGYDDEEGGGGGGGRISLLATINEFAGSWNTSGGAPGETPGNYGEEGTLFKCTGAENISCPGNGNGVSLSTGYSPNASMEVNRTLLTLSQNSAVWNDSADITTTATYSLTGLKPSSIYSVFDNGALDTKLLADEQGNLPAFSITLGSEHQINVTETGLGNLSNITSVILNATDHPINSTDATLNAHVSYETDEGSPLHYDWTRLGRAYTPNPTGVPYSDLVMRFMFENYTGSSDILKDSSPNDIQTTVQTAVWKASSGPYGTNNGAYEFDGDDYIALDYSYNGIVISQVTACAWFNTSYTDGTTNQNWAFIDFDRSAYYDFYITGEGRIGFSTNTGTDAGDIHDFYSSQNGLNDGTWHHACAIYDGADKHIYIDGKLDSTETNPHSGANLGASDAVRYGFIGDGSEATTYDGSRNNVYYEGQLDDIIVWHNSLNTTQVSQVYNRGTSSVLPNETEIGDIWQVSVTPYDEFRTGESALSNPLNVTEGIPEQAPNITFVSLNATDHPDNTTDANLTLYLNVTDANGDSVKNITVWHKGGQPVQALNMPFEGGSNSTWTRDYAYGNNGSITNANWLATGGYDGKGAYEFTGTDYITLSNSDELSPENDNITLSAWVKINDKTTTRWVYSDYGSTTNLVVLGYQESSDSFYGMMRDHEGDNATAVGLTSPSVDKWYHVALVRHGKNASIYVNGVLENSSENSLLDSIYTSDGAEPALGTYGANPGGALNWDGTIDDVQIWNTALSPEQIKTLYHNRTDLIVSHETEVGDTWHAKVTPNDGIQDGITRQSNNVTIVSTNSPPTEPVLLSPSNGSTIFERLPEYYWNNSEDPDGDRINYTLQVSESESFGSFTVNIPHIEEQFGQYTTTQPSTTLEVDTTYFWRVIATDGSLTATSETENFTVQSLLSVTLRQDNVTFINMTLGQTNDTLNNNPQPFILENTGNVQANITITAEQMFTSVPYPGSDYQFLVQDSESGSIDTGASTTSFENMTNTSTRNDIAQLNWPDATDTARVDIRITVPAGELGTEKNSTVEFGASLGGVQ